MTASPAGLLAAAAAGLPLAAPASDSMAAQARPAGADWAAEPGGADWAAALRAEVRAVLRGPGARAAWLAFGQHRGWAGENDPRPLYRLLGRHRLLAPNWPRAYGGRALPARSAAIIAEEMIAAAVPEVLHTLSVQICGNFLISAGTPPQRAALLPALAAGTAYCTVLYTEPGVGSDLASLATRAEPGPGGSWLITGHKVYSVRTGLADTGLVAARTEQGASPYHGITLFLVPLGAPGVTITPVRSMADEAFADVRLSQVRVTADSVIGPPGGAWPLITAALALERTGAEYVAKAETWLRAWHQHVAGRAAAGRAGAGPDSGAAAEQLAQAGRLWTRTQAGRALSGRFLAQIDDSHVDPVGAAVVKLWTSETARDVAWWCAEDLGEAALSATVPVPAAEAGAAEAAGTRGADGAAEDAAGRLEAAYREAPGLTIQAGTSEMMLELIAAAGLPAGQAGTDWLAGTGARAAEADGQLAADLRRSIRWALTGLPGDGATSGAPVTPGDANPPGAPVTPGDPDPAEPPRPGWPLLASFGLFGLNVPAAAGGYGLGPGAALAAAAELGAAGYDGGLLDTLTVIDALAAAPVTAGAGAYLPGLLAGRRAAALAYAGRPLRPATDPGPGGFVLVMPSVLAEGCLAESCLAGDSPAPFLLPLPDAGPRFAGGAVSASRVRLAGEPHDGVAISVSEAAARAAAAVCEGPAACAVTRADLLRRAAWLLGAGTACLTAAARRASTRQQFGRALADNQSVSFRLASLAAWARACHELLSWHAADQLGETQQHQEGTPRGAAGCGLAGAAGALAEAGRFAAAAAREAVQLHGAFGMLAGSPVEPLYRRIRIMIAQCPPAPVLDRLAAAAIGPAGEPEPQPGPGA